MFHRAITRRIMRRALAAMVMMILGAMFVFRGQAIRLQPDMERRRNPCRHHHKRQDDSSERHGRGLTIQVIGNQAPSLLSA